MIGMSQVQGENPKEAPFTGEYHSDFQVSNRGVWERTSNSESLAYEEVAESLLVQSTFGGQDGRLH